MPDNAIGAPSAKSGPSYMMILLAAFASAYGVGLLSLIALPFVVGANTASLGLDETRAGFLGTLEFAGVVVASLLVAPRIGHIDRRRIAMVGAAMVVTANVLCALFGRYEQLLMLRPFAGIGGGLALAAGNATVASADNPEEFASRMTLLFVALMVAIMFSFAELSSALGQTGVYWGLAVTVALLSPLLHWLPRAPMPEEMEDPLHHKGHESLLSFGSIAVISAVLFFSMRDTMAWAFTEAMGVSAGYSPREVGRILGIQAVVGLAGPAIASIIGSRYGLRLPLVIGILCSGAVTVLVSQSAGHPMLFLCAAMFWTGSYFFTLSYLTALAAELDSEGRIVAATGSALMAGLAIAPLIAGYLISIGGRLGMGEINAALVLATLAAVLLAVRALRYSR